MGRKKGGIKMPDGYVSTGEAPKMLGIAQTTVDWYFARGILAGQQHPITNLRRIKKASVLALMKKYGMQWKEQS